MLVREDLQSNFPEAGEPRKGAWAELTHHLLSTRSTGAVSSSRLWFHVYQIILELVSFMIIPIPWTIYSDIYQNTSMSLNRKNRGCDLPHPRRYYSDSIYIFPFLHQALIANKCHLIRI